ncbi:MAG: hypothetical protein KGL25_14675, partial [Gammaproteobacteria bacterium]|nr:hypothetical protein [Gammaproteobacteria bacterium]
MRKYLITAIGVAAVIAGARVQADAHALAASQKSTEGLAMQSARATMMTERGHKIAYTSKFDLSGLPPYVPKQTVRGTLRLWGSNYIVDG